MSYYVDIIDQVLLESKFVLEKASRSSIILNWGGSDVKDELSIVGSSLTFNFAHIEKVDAKFIEFFTGNEVRYKVELRNTNDEDVLIWSGFVVPDTYSEPYTNGVTFVEFTASCGLGRLKGKYLPEDYYRDEKSVIDIICKILSLTGLELDVYFNPAIENSVQKGWDLIYLDTTYFFADDKKEKKQDAYAILDKILLDTLCVCFQADNRWNIEGLNKRHIRSYKAKLYDFNGVLLGEVDNLKLLKRITSLVTPTITMIPPYNLITVTHERKPQAFPDTISKESNEGWSVVSGVVGEIYATDWNGNADYYCRAYSPDYYNAVKKEYVDPELGGMSEIQPFDENKFINLKNKIYLYKYQKVTLTIAFSIIKYAKVMSDLLPQAWYNPLLYAILLNDQVIYSNRKTTADSNEMLSFDEDGKVELVFDWIVPFDGLLDVKLWRPSGPVYRTNIMGFEITKLNISPVAFDENFVVTDVISDEFTVDKEIELTYSDDDSAFSKAFRLAKVKEATISYNTILIPVIYAFVQNENYFSVVSLKGANLIKDNINTVVYDGEILENLEIIYNYNASEQMVVRTDFAITSGNFSVDVYKNDDVLGSRSSWLQWTDSVYKIETDRYQKTVCNIVRRMFNEASEKLDVVALNAVKFNDLILFHYVYDKQFVPINCSWNLDENKTQLTLARGIYRDSGDTGENPDNIPPIVNAGLDLFLESGQTSASLKATAYDVDGTIVFQKWTKLKGGFGDIISSPNQLETTLENLTEDQYEYQIEVKDNDGASAVDTIMLLRRRDYTAEMNLVYQIGDGHQPFLFFNYQFNIDPNIDSSYNLLLKGTIGVFAYNAGLVTSFARFRVKKNGVVIFSGEWEQGYAISEFPFSIGYISTDTILFEIEQSGEFPDIHFGSSYINLESVEFITGVGNVLGIPIHAQVIPFIPFP